MPSCGWFVRFLSYVQHSNVYFWHDSRLFQDDVCGLSLRAEVRRASGYAILNRKVKSAGENGEGNHQIESIGHSGKGKIEQTDRANGPPKNLIYQMYWNGSIVKDKKGCMLSTSPPIRRIHPRRTSYLMESRSTVRKVAYVRGSCWF